MRILGLSKTISDIFTHNWAEKLPPLRDRAQESSK